jgi:hypothetical protein
MAKQTVVQNEDGTTTVYVRPDVIGTVGEVVGCLGGIVAGGFVGVQVWKAVGPAEKTLEKVAKAFLVGSVSTATEYYVSEGISKTFNDISQLSDMGANAIRERSQRIIEQAAGQPVQQVPAQQQETKKK